MTTSSSISRAAKNGASHSIETQQGVNAAKTDVDLVAIFTKFVKKAEEAAQSSI